MEKELERGNAKDHLPAPGKLCLLTEANAWDIESSEHVFEPSDGGGSDGKVYQQNFVLGGTFAGKGTRQKRCHSMFQVVRSQDPVESLCAKEAWQGDCCQLNRRERVGAAWGSARQRCMFLINEPLGSCISLHLAMAAETTTLWYTCQEVAQQAQSSPMPEPAKQLGTASAGPKECQEPLALVCDSNSWTVSQAFMFGAVSSMHGHTVAHQLALRLQPAPEDEKQGAGLLVSWQFAFVSVSFQILSVSKQWDWRIVPSGRDKAWNSQNLLVPGVQEAVQAVVTVNADGTTLHGRDFHLVERCGTEVLLSVELDKAEPGQPPRAKVWYEVATRRLYATAAADKRPVSKEAVLTAFQCRGLEASAARRHWDQALAARCPGWWQAWAKREAQQERRAKRLCRQLGRASTAGVASGSEGDSTGLSKEELLSALHRLAERLREHQPALAAARKSSTVKLSFTDSFPYMPPQAISTLSRVVEQALGPSAEGGLRALWIKGAHHLWDLDVQEAMDGVRVLLEVGERKAVPSGKQLAVRSGGQLTSADGTKLEGGMRVMVRWQTGSVGAIHLAYLNGHIGILGSFDGSSRRWQVSFETFDGHLDIGAEHLHVCPQLANRASQKAPRPQGFSCEMCLSQFLETQIRTIPCKSQHSYCQECLRKWVLSQLVPRCYRCLDDLNILMMPQGRSEPWHAVVAGETEATNVYRIGKEDIDRLECVCCFDVCSGAKCIIIGIKGLVGERCIVGRVEKNQAESFAIVFDKKGRRRQVHVACLAVDDCLSSGRTSRGDPCPSKGEGLSLGLGVASLGCACVVKQAMDEMFVEQLAMPFDWLVSRVEGVLYFFRHGFRDFTHYDDVQVVGEHGYTSFRSAYHAFPHHDISTGASKGAFQRRGERLLELVKSCTEASARPLLLIRVCARSEELDWSEELYAYLRLLGGQKLFLLVVITEQLRFLGAVQHLQLSNLIFYVCQEGCRDLADAVRFGMDYSYAAVTFGQHSLEAAKAVSLLSPVPSASSLRKSLGQAHRHWLKRDSRGLSPTSDINGCFEKGPDQFFPGRFHKGSFEASPDYLRHLESKVLRGDAIELDTAISREKRPDLNAWDHRGETLLHKAATRGRPETLALLVLAAADPNCRSKDGRQPLDLVPRGPSTELARALLLLTSGEENTPLEVVLKVVEAVPEPWRRQLCSRLGLYTSPDRWTAPAAEGRLAKSAQVLFAPSLDEEAAAVPGATEALAALRQRIRKPQEERRQLLRRLLREWHPDKFQTLSQEKQEEANTVFCFIQRFRGIFLCEET